MYNEVKIGEKTVPMLSLASVNVYFSQLFHEDPFELQSSDKPQFEFYTKMAFIMAKYAELKKSNEMRKLTQDQYVDWLADFEQADFVAALPDVMLTYHSQSISMSESKKNTDQPSGE